ncbi:MAG: GDP-mannose mannosyl hydrolase [Colwellia sp.]|jgi:colanic acid biosynthesis protein WcaH|nr:MAG: GDP-mannose mannosyl hydrolase [Colwellia sp.]
MLPLETFKKIIASTPLISIDLIVKNKLGQVLLGKRNNRPAKGFWFVPGGRILKDETFKKAYARLLNEELGILNKNKAVKFIGNYQHFYQDNFSTENFTTHYVVMAYEINFVGDISQLSQEQHNKYRWFELDQLLNDEKVHKHTKWYFQPNKQADKKIVIRS